MVRYQPSHAGAIVVAADAPDAVLAAVGAQTVPGWPVIRVGSLFSAAAAVGGAEWMWLLDGTAVPREDALRALLEAAETAAGLPAPPPALLASKVVRSGGGGVDPADAPWYRRGGETDLAMRAARAGLLPVRTAPAGSLLVRREAALATGTSRSRLHGRGAALEWTARLLRERTGYLAPASVADAGAPVGPGGPGAGVDELRVTAAMLAGPGWHAKEKLWLAFEAAGRAGGALRARAGGAGRR